MDLGQAFAAGVMVGMVCGLTGYLVSMAITTAARESALKWDQTTPGSDPSQIKPTSLHPAGWSALAVNRSAPPARSEPTRIIAGAFCLVEGGQIVRATAPSRSEELLRFWAAGRGSWSRSFGEAPRRFWPVHYAGSGRGPSLNLTSN